jgi:hypothetical protein
MTADELEHQVDKRIRTSTTTDDGQLSSTNDQIDQILCSLSVKEREQQRVMQSALELIAHPSVLERAKADRVCAHVAFGIKYGVC